MATTGFSASVYYSIPDAAGMTLPNGDWTWVHILRTPAVLDVQDITANGAYQATNTLNIYIGNGGNLRLDLSALNSPDDSVALSINTWYVVTVTRGSGQLNLRVVPFGSTSVSTGTGVAISAAYNSATGYVFGIANDLALPFDGGMADSIFIPGVALSDADMGDIATGTAMNSTGWWASREFHLIMSNGTDHTGNHTVTVHGSPSALADPVQLVRFGTGETIVQVGLATETDSAFGIASATTVQVGLATETDSAFGIGVITPPSLDSAVTGFSAVNFLNVADHADLTAPNGDWARIVICRPDSDVTGAEFILSDEGWGLPNSFNLISSGGFFGVKVNETIDRYAAFTAGTWHLVCAQRSGTSLTIRCIRMGDSFVTTSAATTLNEAVDSPNPLAIGLNGFTGAVSDVLFINGATVSDADLQAIATSTAIDSFAWYGSRVFWGILEAQTGLDQTGNHTITENGTLTDTTGSPDLVRFGFGVRQAIESDTAFGFTWSKSIGLGLANETDTSLSILTPIVVSVGFSTEVDTAFGFTKNFSYLLPLASETDIGQNIAAQVLSIINIFQADEIDSGQIITTKFRPVNISQAIETDSAQAITGLRALSLLLGLETDSPGPMFTSKLISLGLSLETDAPGPMFTVKELAIGLGWEFDDAFGVGRIGGELDQIPLTNDGIKILIDDRIKNATVAGNGTTAGFSINNLKTDDKHNIWRSIGLGTQLLVATWGTPQPISCVGFVFSNLIVGSTVRIKLFTNSGDVQASLQTPLITVNHAYDPPHGFASIGYLSFPFGGGNYVSAFFEESLIEKIEITVTSAGNPDGFIDLARLVAGPAISLTSQSGYKASVGQIDRTETDRADGGDFVANRGTQSKELKLPLGKLTRGDTALYNSIMRAVGRNIPIFVSALGDSDNPEDVVSYQIYGQRNKNLGISPLSHNRASSTLIISEI